MTTKGNSGANRVLRLSTCGFTLLFNVWLMLGVLGISVRLELGFSDSQLEWLRAAATLSGKCPGEQRADYAISSRREFGAVLLEPQIHGLEFV